METFDKILILVRIVCCFLFKSFINFMPFISSCFISYFISNVSCSPEILCSTLKNLPFRKSTPYRRRSLAHVRRILYHSAVSVGQTLSNSYCFARSIRVKFISWKFF